MSLGIPGVRVGCWTHELGHTGVTVVLPPKGTLGAMAVRGGGPGTRESAILSAGGSALECHAVVLSGGSAFGLASADGVVAWCEEHGIGLERVVARIPIVGAAIVFDLGGEGFPRPDRDAGYAAAAAATEADPPMGRAGVGAGCTVGKIGGIDHRVPGGQGWAIATGGGITVGALLAVNALGDVLAEDGSILAGGRYPPGAPRYPFASPLFPPAPGDGGAPLPADNTVIGCVVTDAVLSKHQAATVADLAHTGVARTVDPVHTRFDGDALFVLATQRVEVEAPVDHVTHLANQAVAAAIRAAVRASAS